MPRLGALRAAHPDIDLMIDPTPQIRPLAPGGIDVALRYGAGDWPGVEAEMLVPSPYAIVAAPDLVGAARIERPVDLLSLPWLQELGTNESTAWLERNGITSGKAHSMTTLPGNLMLEAARAGQGVAIVAKALIEDDLATDRLRLLFTDYESKGYYLVTAPGVLRPSARKVVTWLRRQRPDQDSDRTGPSSSRIRSPK
jgi:LysR family glycine cleavage system transcriptional activator